MLKLASIHESGLVLRSNCFKKKNWKFFSFKLIFLILLNYFNILILKINFIKNIYYFNKFLNKI